MGCCQGSLSSLGQSPTEIVIAAGTAPNQPNKKSINVSNLEQPLPID